MAESFLRLTEFLLGDQIAPFARFLHGLVLAVLGLCWFLPPVLAYVRERRKTRGTYWMPMWHCRKCGHFSPPDFVECQVCRTPMETPWWARFFPVFAVDMARSGAKFLLASYGVLGKAIFYGATLLAFWNLRLYTFAQYPLQEIMAGLVMVLLLLTLSFFGRAFSARLESPVARLADLVAALGLSGFLLLAGFLWAASPFPPDKPLAYVHPLGQGQVRLMSPGGLQTLAPAQSARGEERFDLQYAELTWPLLYLDQIFITRLGRKAVLDPWTLLTLEAAARTFRRDDPYRFRAVLLSQNFSVEPGKTYALRRARQGAGLVLEEKEK